MRRVLSQREERVLLVIWRNDFQQRLVIFHLHVILPFCSPMMRMTNDAHVMPSISCRPKGEQNPRDSREKLRCKRCASHWSHWQRATEMQRVAALPAQAVPRSDSRPARGPLGLHRPAPKAQGFQRRHASSVKPIGSWNI